MFPISKRKINQHSGFNLIDFLINLLIALAILGFLFALIGPSLVCDLDGDSPRRYMALAQLANLETAIEAYHQDMSEYPKTLEGLIKNETTDPRWRGPYLQKSIIPRDPWANPFQYQILGPEGKEYDLYSYGADGILGGEGESADIRNWAEKNGD